MSPEMNLAIGWFLMLGAVVAFIGAWLLCVGLVVLIEHFLTRKKRRNEFDSRMPNRILFLNK